MNSLSDRGDEDHDHDRPCERASERATLQKSGNNSRHHQMSFFLGSSKNTGCSCSDFDARMFKVHPFGASRQFACESIFTPSSAYIPDRPILWYHSYHRGHRGRPPQATSTVGGSDQSSAPLSNSHEYFRVNQRRRRRRRFYYGKCFAWPL